MYFQYQVKTLHGDRRLEPASEIRGLQPAARRRDRPRGCELPRVSGSAGIPARNMLIERSNFCGLEVRAPPDFLDSLAHHFAPHICLTLESKELLLKPMRRALFLFLSLILLGAGPQRPVIVSIPPASPVEVTAGGSVDYSLELKILKGYHIQANPASQEYLIAVTAKLEPVEGLKIGEPVYPKGIPFRLKGSDRDISTYEDSVVIKIPIQTEKGLKPGEIVLKGSLRYQGCDAILCFPPSKLPFEAKLLVR